jgi:hypothetical protein
VQLSPFSLLLRVFLERSVLECFARAVLVPRYEGYGDFCAKCAVQLGWEYDLASFDVESSVSLPGFVTVSGICTGLPRLLTRTR